MWKAAFEALGSTEDIVVLLACGPKEYALEGLIVPQNFMPFPMVPQLEVLPLCNVFVTHGGMGSIMESVMCGVPMVVIPAFGDQPANADNVQKLNMGITFQRPRETLGAESLRKAIAQLLDPTLSEEGGNCVHGGENASRRRSCQSNRAHFKCVRVSSRADHLQ